MTPVLAVCGGKDVGKSSFCRYLLNSTLSRCGSSAVAYLECDVGQTEFTPPGCVALHLVTEPLLGPPFTHQRPALSMCHVGALSPADDARHYVACLQRVYRAYTRLALPRPPLIINTMGWNKGLGVALLLDALRLTRPDTIVQFEKRGSQGKNLPPMSAQFVHAPPEAVQRLCVLREVPGPLPTHRLVLLQSPVRAHANSLTPLEHRNHSLLAYLGGGGQGGGEDRVGEGIQGDGGEGGGVQGGGGVGEWLSRPPLRVSLCDVALHVCHEAVPRAHTLYALNASVVALCVADPSQLIDTGVQGAPKFLQSTPVCDCLGLGVVRSIDAEGGYIYIQTPLPLCALQGVNCLLRGGVELPPTLLMAQSGGGELYVGRPKDVVGASAVKRRRSTSRLSSLGGASMPLAN